MTREEAIEVLENQDVSIGVVARIGQEPEYWRKLKPALDMAISALRQKGQERNAPLTLDEMRKMPIRDWVWIEILNPDAFRSKETVSAYYRKYDGYKKGEIFWCGYPGLGFEFDYADYGKTWMAYRQKPEEWTV